MSPQPPNMYPDTTGAAAVGFDGVQAPAAGGAAAAPVPGPSVVQPQQPTLGNYPPAAAAAATGDKPPGGYPSVTPPGGGPATLPPGYPGARPPTYTPAGAPPHATVGMPVGPAGGVAPGGAEDKIGPLGITAWVLFVIGIFFPIAWVVCCFLPICAKNAAKGPKDFLAVRRAAVSASIALCLYLVLIVVFVSLGQTGTLSPRRNVCIDRVTGTRFYC